MHESRGLASSFLFTIALGHWLPSQKSILLAFPAATKLLDGATRTTITAYQLFQTRHDSTWYSSCPSIIISIHFIPSSSAFVISFPPPPFFFTGPCQAPKLLSSLFYVPFVHCQVCSFTGSPPLSYIINPHTHVVENAHTDRAANCAVPPAEVLLTTSLAAIKALQLGTSAQGQTGESRFSKTELGDLFKQGPI